MKLRHHVHIGTPKPEPISERYQAEIDRALSRAERVWRSAERQRIKAEARQQNKPSNENARALELARQEAERLWLEFDELDRLMRQGPSGGANRSGRGSVRRVGKGGSGE